MSEYQKIVFEGIKPTKWSPHHDVPGGDGEVALGPHRVVVVKVPNLTVQDDIIALELCDIL